MMPVCIFFSVLNSRCSSIFFLFTSISLAQLETMGEKCLCGNVVIQQTSWTQANPRRRFATCVDRRCNKSSDGWRNLFAVELKLSSQVYFEELTSLKKRRWSWKQNWPKML
ncbi:hypothetical protein DCAR_0623268 [Daucus carota subsp. sativus]|uniref:Zinc finger GRF-type domain-containing protein n=1 Tax=Daucus carota subsp. sativus TaxID=79200 RepID=A0A161ZTB4_DAUCS|nr:hypothetical protein DCAR_0623268 [Daucus carota subsp. sativus]